MTASIDRRRHKAAVPLLFAAFLGCVSPPSPGDAKLDTKPKSESVTEFASEVRPGDATSTHESNKLHGHSAQAELLAVGSFRELLSQWSDPAVGQTREVFLIRFKSPGALAVDVGERMREAPSASQVEEALGLLSQRLPRDAATTVRPYPGQPFATVFASRSEMVELANRLTFDAEADALQLAVGPTQQPLYVDFRPDSKLAVHASSAAPLNLALLPELLDMLGISIPAEERGPGAALAVIDSSIDDRWIQLQQAGVSRISGGGSVITSYSPNLGAVQEVEQSPGAWRPVQGGHPTEFSHGTRVAIFAAADGTANDGRACLGVAPSARLLAYRVQSAQGAAQMLDVLKSMQLAFEARGTDRLVINLSMGADSFYRYPEVIRFDPSADLFDREVEKLWEQGVVLVASGGNESNYGVAFPALLPRVVAVAAVDAAQPAYLTSSFGAEIDLLAPGSSMGFERIDLPPGWHLGVNGSSFAAPLVAGSIALLLGKHPTRSPEEVLNALLATGDLLGSSSHKASRILVDAADTSLRLSQVTTP